jgi:hypothetical protein
MKDRPERASWRDLVGRILTLLWIGAASVLARILVGFFAPYAFYIYAALGLVIALVILRGLWKVFHAEPPTTLKLK